MRRHSADTLGRIPRSSPASAEGLTFAYRQEPVVDDVTFDIAAGEFVALVGPNGSGKSTLLRLLLGLLVPDRGKVRLFGDDPRRLRDRFRVGYVPQRAVLPADLPATVAEVVGAGRIARRGWWRPPSRADRDARGRALAAVALSEMARTRVGELSGGQQQRVLIAKALAGDPELLVLDEPVSGVDAESQARFRNSLVHLVNRGGTVLLVSHELGAVADDLDRVIVMKRGIMFDGTPAELAATGVSLGVHRDDLPLWLERLR
jgi:zinc transport system ATP-binding protein